MMTVPIVGLTRVRNEEAIINSTLNWYSRYCTDGIYVLDEASDDNTVKLCRQHTNVRAVIELMSFEENPQERRRFEGWPRQMLLNLARAQNVDPNLWVTYFDADERMEWNVNGFNFDAYDAASFRLFDCCITPDDENLSASRMEERKWFGPEHRMINMVFNARAITRFIDRSPVLVDGARVHPHAGDVRHYGKAVSVAEFDRTVDYYVDYQPSNFARKWEARRGKAVHASGTDGVMRSDFGGELMLWEEREAKGYPLVDNSLD